MRKPSELLQKLDEFAKTLDEYHTYLRTDMVAASEKSRADLNVLFGDVHPELQALGLLRTFRYFDYSVPIFETAIQPFDSRHPTLKFQALAFALDLLNAGKGRLRQLAKEGDRPLGEQLKERDPEVAARTDAAILKIGAQGSWRSYWMSSVLFLAFVAGWVAGRNEARIFALGLPTLIATAVLGVVATLFINFTGGEVRQAGWSMRAKIYLAIAVFFAILAAAVTRLR